MKYIKTYEGLFDILNKQEKSKKLNTLVLQDLVLSDLEDKKFLGVEVSNYIYFYTSFYKSNVKGLPVLGSDNWFNTNIKFAKNRLNSWDELNPFKNRSSEGIALSISVEGITHFRPEFNNVYQYNMEMDLRDRFNLINFIYNSINYNRMKEYGIGYCFFTKNIDYDSILFYSL